MKKKIKTLLNKDIHLKDLIKGGSVSLVFRIIGLIIGYTFTLFVSRNYGSDTMGILSLSIMVLTISTVIGKVGIDTALLRFTAEYCSQQKWKVAKELYFKAICIVLPIAILLTVSVYMASSYLAVNVFDAPNLTEYFQVASFGIVPVVWLTLNREVVRGMKKIGLYAFINNIAVSLLSFILLITLYYYLPMNEGMPIYTYVASNILISIVVLIILYSIFKKKISNQTTDLEQKSISAKHLLSVAFPMFLTGSMSLVMGSADTVMLGIFCTVADIGIYAVALKVSMVTNLALVAVNSVAAPKFAELWSKNDLKGLEYVARLSTKLIFYSSLPALLLFWLFPGVILGIFGDEFIAGTLALMILAIGQFINAVSGPIGQFMNMTGNQKVLQYTAMMATVVNIVMNYILIPKYGITGAAIATATAGSFWNLSCVFYLKFKHGILMLYIPFMNVGKPRVF